MVALGPTLQVLLEDMFYFLISSRVMVAQHCRAAAALYSAPEHSSTQAQAQDGTASPANPWPGVRGIGPLVQEIDVRDTVRYVPVTVRGAA